MTLFEQFHVHIFKPVHVCWTDADGEEACAAFNEEELAALLEAVANRYLQRHPLTRQLMAGVSLLEGPHGPETPLLTATLPEGQKAGGSGEVIGFPGNGDEHPAS